MMRRPFSRESAAPERERAAGAALSHTYGLRIRMVCARVAGADGWRKALAPSRRLPRAVYSAGLIATLWLAMRRAASARAAAVSRAAMVRYQPTAPRPCVVASEVAM